MKIFSDFDVYNYTYTYDEMKVMHMLGVVYDTKGLEYEDLMCIAEAVYYHWANDDEVEEEKLAAYPWMEIQGFEEEGYIQAYAQRTLPEYIKLYEEQNKMI